MLKCELIGHLGADAEVKDVDGVKFLAMRVADSQRWKDSQGITHDSVRWVDVTIREYEKLLPYLKKGTLVYVRGHLDTRVYSSEKDRCYKCGLSIRMQEIQLLSASSNNGGTQQAGENEQSGEQQTMNPNEYTGF